MPNFSNIIKSQPFKLKWTCYYSCFLLIVILSSCSSIKEGYVSSSTFTNGTLLSDIKNQKSDLFIQTDSITQQIASEKKLNKQLKGQEINLLFENLHSHLIIDQQLTNLFQDKTSNNEAATMLYNSASKYQNFYSRDKYISQTINRGDKSLVVPKKILNKTRRFIKSKKIQKQLPALPLQPINTNTTRPFCFNNFIYQTSNVLSGAFGNIAGLFHKNINQEKNIQLLSDHLQPFDIVLSKSRKHMTDNFIPGYFGHSAIWLGNYKQLKTNGFNDAPMVLKFKHYFQNGAGMFESLRSKTTLNTLQKYADGDDYLIIRHKNLTNQNKRTILSALRHNNKKYDFNFNIESPDRLFCTELIYYAFGFIDWKGEKKMNRYTLKPDNLLKTALNNSNFEIVLWISEGKIKTSNLEEMQNTINYND